ncbi:MAG: amidohydrolase family protein [Candidatus Hodarchaeota archaeon]
MKQNDSAKKKQQVTAFVNVNVIPMENEQIRENQSVVVENERIIKIGPTEEVTIPEGAFKINGEGRFLMPGLADMHVHLNMEEMMLLFVAHGVTTIRSMWGFDFTLEWREKVKQKEVIGPTIYTTGPLIDGSPSIWDGSAIVDTTEDAERIVAEHHKAGYDFIKVYNNLSVEAYQGIISAAKKRKLPVVGHIPYAMTLEGAMKAGQKSNEHLGGYIGMLQSDDSPIDLKSIVKDARKTSIEAIKYIDIGKISKAVNQTKEAELWNCVTLVVYEKIANMKDAEKLQKKPEMKYVSPFLRARWDPSKDFRVKNTTPEEWELMKKENQILKRITKALSEAGANLLLGTDTPNPFVVPGYSIYEELQLLIEAGLTPYQALRMGTWNAAEFVNAVEEFGTVTEGKRADLILLEANPLEEVRNVAKHAGVMVRGQWFSKTKIDQMLEELVKSYEPPEDFFEGQEPLPIEGEREFYGEYRTTYNDTIDSEERFAIERISKQKRRIRSQSVFLGDNSAWITKIDIDNHAKVLSWTLEIKRKEELVAKLSGEQGEEEIQVTRSTSLEGWQETTHIVPDDSILTIHLAPDTLVVERVQELAVGESLKLTTLSVNPYAGFQLVNVPIKVTRMKDDTIETTQGIQPVKQYEIDVKHENFEYTTMLTVDAKNHLISREDHTKMGIYHFHLKQE